MFWPNLTGNLVSFKEEGFPPKTSASSLAFWRFINISPLLGGICNTKKSLANEITTPPASTACKLEVRGKASDFVKADFHGTTFSHTKLKLTTFLRHDLHDSRKRVVGLIYKKKNHVVPCKSAFTVTFFWS